MRLSQALAARKINVQPIVHPAVEENAARLRFFISATHSEEEIRHSVQVLSEELGKLGTLPYFPLIEKLGSKKLTRK
jgi:8-amino-7-oxononanoate synthase